MNSSILIALGVIVTTGVNVLAFVQYRHAVLRAPINIFTINAFEEHDEDASIFYPSTSLPSASTQWGIADDWSALSTDNTAVSNMYSSDFDVMDQAAQILKDQAEQFSSRTSDWGTADKDSSYTTITVKDHGKKKTDNKLNDDFVENAVDMIAGNLDYNEPDGVQLYDTISSVNTQRKRDHVEDEISLMIRCNQTPEQFLIEKGRALPELTDEMKYSAEFLLETVATGSDSSQNLPLQPKMTSFFQQSVRKIFDRYSVKTADSKILDRKALSQWISTCTKQTLGEHDNSISVILSRYSQSHGSGRLTFEEFRELYLEAAWSGFVRDVRENKGKYLDYKDGSTYQTPSAEEGVLVQGKKNTERLLEQSTLDLVWRDLEAHGIFSPVELERIKLLEEITSHVFTVTTSKSEMLVDECELFDEYEERLAHQTYSDQNDNDLVGVKRDWDLLDRRQKGSHELVEMTTDGQVPKRIRDGQFCFIDEESCIGCTQCAMIAPSTFTMIEETGRARAFFQSASIDVENAVLSCPVHCMHMVSFDELKELEVARDKGDGRTDHRHFGNGKSHKPLHVSRRDSDANHKSSWYHYLKSKCAGSSCPQRGCYDCPKYLPGKNPFFMERHKHFEHVRARDFIVTGEADKWRKVAEL